MDVMILVLTIECTFRANQQFTLKAVVNNLLILVNVTIQFSDLGDGSVAVGYHLLIRDGISRGFVGCRSCRVLGIVVC